MLLRINLIRYIFNCCTDVELMSIFKHFCKVTIAFKTAFFGDSITFPQSMQVLHAHILRSLFFFSLEQLSKPPYISCVWPVDMLFVLFFLKDCFHSRCHLLILFLKLKSHIMWLRSLHLVFLGNYGT